MNWKCPHCSAQVFAETNVIKPGWSFAQCHQCLGFSLVRKVEMSVIKIDRPPLDEKDVLSTQPPLASARLTVAIRPEEISVPPPFKHTQVTARVTLMACAFVAAFIGTYHFFHLQPEPTQTQAAVVLSQSEKTVVKVELPKQELAQIVSTNVKLRSGPGMEYVQVALANPNKSYTIKNRSNNWVQLELDESDETSEGRPTSAWVRDDLIRKVAALDHNATLLHNE